MKKQVAGDFIKRGIFFVIGFLSFLYITLNLTFWIVPVAVCAVCKPLMPFAWVKKTTTGVINRIYHLAVSVNDWLFFSILQNNIDFNGKEELAENQNYLVLANHRSWVDILVLQSLLNKRGGPIQFIVKRELILMPLIGLICWAYGYPFVRRASLKSSQKNILKTEKDFNRIGDNFDKESGFFLCLINFVEGTRFSPVKFKKFSSRYRHLLNPRVGGLHYILKNYGEKLHVILDFTIAYECAEPIFWKFLAGRCKRIRIDLQKIPMAVLIKNLGTTFSDIEVLQVAAWIKGLWKEKDAKIERMLSLPD